MCRMFCKYMSMKSYIPVYLNVQGMLPIHIYPVYILVLCRVCCCTDPQALGRLYWPGPWLTTQSVPSSACLDLNWCKSSLERAPGWCESSSLWPGNSIVLIVSHLFCQTGFNCDKKCQFFFFDKILQMSAVYRC